MSLRSTFVSIFCDPQRHRIQNTVYYKYKWFYHLAACFKTAVGHFPQSKLSIILVGGQLGAIQGLLCAVAAHWAAPFRSGFCPPPREIAVEKGWLGAAETGCCATEARTPRRLGHRVHPATHSRPSTGA